jgi:SAM-dependent methyltransferase
MDTEGARTFLTSGDAYDAFMGRYSRVLAPAFADHAGVAAGQSVLDVGCGPGALTGVLVERVGAGAVAAFDPSPPFVADCAARHPGVDVRQGRAEQIPFDDATFDAALAQLVLHFVTEPSEAAAEMRRVVRPGGVVAACVWDLTDTMEMLRLFWDAAQAIDAAPPADASAVRFGDVGEIAGLFEASGLTDVHEVSLAVASSYGGFDELWTGFLAGIGPAGAFCASLPEDQRRALRDELFRRVGSPGSGFTLAATARSARGRVPAG